MSAFLFGGCGGLGIAVLFRLIQVTRLSRSLKSLKKEPVAGEWVRIEAVQGPGAFIVSVRGKKQVATSQTHFDPGQPARIVSAGIPLKIEPWPS